MRDQIFTCPRPVLNPGLRLFCFPYAGGGPSVFHDWHSLLPDSVETICLQLPGRGTRLLEAPYCEMSQVVASIVAGIRPFLDRTFFFFGHSMGALVAFELARELRRRKWDLPGALLISGCQAPQIKRRDRVIHTLPEEELINELGRLNGTNPILLENREFMELILPALRADFSVFERYWYREEEPLPCPIAAFGGSEDPRVRRDELGAWRTQTSSDFLCQFFAGSHFFLHENRTELLKSVSSQLSRFGFEAGHGCA